MMPTERLREELSRAKHAAAEMTPSTASEQLRRCIDRIERHLSR